MSDKPKNWRTAIKKGAKKVAKKVAKKTVAVVKVAATRRISPVVPPKKQDRREGKRMDEMEELREDNQTLREEITKLRTEAKAAAAIAIKGQVSKWVRGKLPGERLIKTDPETGKFEEIDKAEWDSLV